MFEDRRAAPALGARPVRSYVPLRCGPSENESENNNFLLADTFSLRDYESSTCIAQNFFQCIFTARVAPYHICVAPACLFHRAADHFVGYGVRKKYDQVRASDLLAQACGHLGEYFCLAVEPSADLLILTYHSVMAAYDHNTHIEPPDDNEDNCACF